MKIIGCDFHPSWQQVAWLDAETGETGECKLVNGDGEAERFIGICRCRRGSVWKPVVTASGSLIRCWRSWDTKYG